MELNSDQLTMLATLCLVGALVLAHFGSRYIRHIPRGGWQGRGHWRRNLNQHARIYQFPTSALSNSAVQLEHVMRASFKKRRILSKAESRIFFAVEKALEQTDTGWRVMAQVNLGEILQSDDKHAFMAINSKRVDILVIGTNGVPIAAVEYQGEGHYQGTAVARDAVKKEALRKAGIGYFEVMPGDKPEDVRRLVARMIEMTQIKSETSTSYPE